MIGSDFIERVEPKTVYCPEEEAMNRQELAELAVKNLKITSPREAHEMKKNLEDCYQTDRKTSN
jgi:hypothetical protein